MFEQVLLACLDHNAPPVLTNLSFQVLSAVTAALYLREAPATRLLPALAALLDRAEIVPATSDSSEKAATSLAGRPQSHPQGVCEAVGSLRLLGRLASWGHNDGALRSRIRPLVSAVR